LPKMISALLQMGMAQKARIPKAEWMINGSNMPGKTSKQ